MEIICGTCANITHVRVCCDGKAGTNGFYWHEYGEKACDGHTERADSIEQVARDMWNLVIAHNRTCRSGVDFGEIEKRLTALGVIV